MSQHSIIAISGPTASGKTSLAIRLAQQLGAEIISFDSRQIYRELSIGVARPSVQELNAVQHHLIASHSIQQPINASQYSELALDMIKTKTQSGQSVILVGGTGFYLRALEYGFDELPDISNTTREEIQNLFEVHGIDYLKSQVRAIDRKSFEKIDSENPRRLQRILELYKEHGLVYSELLTEKKAPKLNIKHLILNPDREMLYQQIEKRVDQMIQLGLVHEVDSLREFQYYQALQTVGYSELFSYFNQELSLDEAITKIKQHTRNYAKRQITWIKKYLPVARTIHSDLNSEQLFQIINEQVI